MDHPDGKLNREECHLDYCYTLKCDGKSWILFEYIKLFLKLFFS